MYTTLKQKTIMKTVAKIFLLLILCLFTLVGTAVLIGTPHAQERYEPPRSGAYYLMVRSDNRIPWENLGRFDSHLACEHAARNMMRIPREKYICVPLSVQ